MSTIALRRQDTIQPSIVKGPAAGTLSFNTDFRTPDEAVGAIFFLWVSAIGGTTPTLDMKFQYQDPVSGLFSDVPGASIVQITTGAPLVRVITIDPRITASANVAVVQPLSRLMRAVFTLDNTTGNSENYTFALSVNYTG